MVGEAGIHAAELEMSVSVTMSVVVTMGVDGGAVDPTAVGEDMSKGTLCAELTVSLAQRALASSVGDSCRR